MNAEYFKNLVKNVPIPGTIVNEYYGATSKGQHFALIINKVLWYKLRLFLEVDNRIGEYVYEESLSEHLFHSNAKSSMSNAKQRLEQTPPLHPLKSSMFDTRIKCDVSKDAAKKPDLYFKVGDQIGISREFYNHEAVYIDHNRVVQVPNTTDPIKECGFDEFLGDKPRGMYYYYYLIWKKTQQEIIDTAKSFVGKRGGEYNLFSRNCQHLASGCVHGLEIPTYSDTMIYQFIKNKSRKCVYVRILYEHEL